MITLTASTRSFITVSLGCLNKMTTDHLPRIYQQGCAVAGSVLLQDAGCNIKARLAHPEANSHAEDEIFVGYPALNQPFFGVN
jgi:hypothetical protein